MNEYLDDAVFVPADVMLDVVEEAQAWLWSDEATTAGRLGESMWRPDLWEVLAGLPPGTFDRWSDHYGEPFVDWFCEAIQPSRGQLAAMRVQYWRTVGRLSVGTSSNAAQLKLVAEGLGLNKERPEPPPVPYMDENTAWNYLSSLGVDLLQEVLAAAQAKEAQRRDPDYEPPEDTDTNTDTPPED